MENKILDDFTQAKGYIIFEYENARLKPIIKRPIGMEFQSITGETIRLLIGDCKVGYLKHNMLRGELECLKFFPEGYPNYKSFIETLKKMPEYDENKLFEDILGSLKVSKFFIQGYTDETEEHPVTLTPVWFSINGKPMEI